MKRTPAALAAITMCLALAVTVAPALAARSSYVIDDAHMLSATAISQLNAQIGGFNAQTGKEVVVVTTPSLNGAAPNDAIERSFAQLQVNGVEIFIAKQEKQIKIAGDEASQRFFPNGSFDTIYTSMRPYFQQGNFDTGVETGVSLILNTYRGHESSLNASRRPVGAVAPTRVRSSSSGGSGLGFIWWIIILAVIFFIIRGIFRAIAGPRMYGGPGYGPGAGPGIGGGYGPGYGGYGYGGGGFWSGLLGGLGGAFLGNELFGRNWGGGGGNVVDGGSWANTGGVDPGTSGDAGGWQSDAGQIDTSNIGGGGWGDSGGGFGDSGGGWGGGGDFGGGGGDSGGGW